MNNEQRELQRRNRRRRARRLREADPDYEKKDEDELLSGCEDEENIDTFRYYSTVIS